MKHYKILFLLLVSSILFSCRDENPAVFNPQDQSGFSSWDDVFESFWNGMNYSYAFWDVDPTDWDAVYREYKPRFQELEFGNSQDSATVKELFTEMTENLIDHHYALTLYDANGEVWYWFSPGNTEAQKRGYYHKDISENIIFNVAKVNIEKGRIKRENAKSAQTLDKGNDNMIMYSYLIDNDIVYLRLDRFRLLGNLENPDIIATLKNFYQLIETTSNLKGIIIDTRNNYGGYLDDMYFLLSPLINKEVTFGYSRTKNGMGRLDYTPWSPLILYPASKAGDEYFLKRFEKLGITQMKRNIENIPIVALADVNSISMGELTPMAIRALPNGYLIGERTRGGHGPLDNNLNNHYAGTFANKAFEVFTSTSLVKNPDGNIYEGIGLTPDIEALYNETEILKGNDTQLERAIQFIHTGK